MANTLRFKRGLASGLPTGLAGEPLFTTDTFDLYIGNGTGNTRFQKYIASGTTSQLLRGDGSLLTMPIVLTSPANGQVLKYDGTNWVNSADAGVTGSGTAGQVTYWGSSSTITGNNNLFWNNTNGFLGIGTNSPNKQLTIAQTFPEINLRRSDSTSPTAAINFTGNDNVTKWQLATNNYIGGAHLEFNYTTSTLMLLRTNGNLLLGSTTDNGLRFQVTGNSSFSDNIGIGGLSSAARVINITKNITGSTIGFGIAQVNNVASDVLSGARVYYSEVGTVAAAFTLPELNHYYAVQGTFGAGSAVTSQYGFRVFSNLTGATNNYGFYSDIASGTGRWNLYMNGTADNYMAGSLGIGTTSSLSTYKLFVAGRQRNQVDQNASSELLDLVNTNTGTSNYVALRFLNGVGTGQILYTGPNTTGYGFANTLMLYQLASNPIQFTTNNLVRATITGGGNILIGSTSDNGLRLQVTGDGYFSGSVGIGTTSPAYLLDIGSTTGTIDLANVGMRIRRSGVSTNWSFIDNNGGALNIRQYDSANPITRFFRSTDGTTWSESMRLDSSGRLLLGTTTSSTFLLDVSGTMRTNGTVARTATIQTSTDNHLVLTTTNSAGDTYTTFENSADANNAWAIGRTNAGSFVINHSTGATYPSGTTTNRFLIDTSGNLGLGVTPSAWSGYKSLDFTGGSIASSGTNNIELWSNAYFDGTNGRYRNNGLIAVYSQTNGEHRWLNAPSGTAGNAITFTQAMTLFSTGNLAVGTTTDAGYKLDVNGTMRVSGASTIQNTMTARQVIVDGANNSNISRINLTRTDVSWGIYNETDFRIYYGTGNTTTPSTQYFSLGSGTGAATFSSSVTAQTGLFGGNLGGANQRVANFRNSGGNAFVELQSSGAGAVALWAASANEFGIYQNATAGTIGTNVFYITSAANIGIGTFTPSYKLDVNGTFGATGAATFSSTAQAAGFITSGGTGYAVINSAATTVTALRPTGGGSSIMSTNSNGLHIAVGTQAAGDLILASNNTERIRLSQNGFFSQLNATNPSASITDSYIQYSADVTAGNAAPHFRTENGAVIKLYQETTAVGNAIVGAGGGSAMLDDDTFDGYTLRQVVRALRNQGILQ